MSLFDPDRSADRLPVSVITGFLGSGKTTLLNHLLRQPDMGDSAVIINEFGDVGLDHLLVEKLDGEVALLASGCICCTLRSDLETTLRDLLARRDRAEVPPFARVLVETTGLADPAPIVQLLLNNPLVSHFVRLDAVVTTVDAVHATRQLDDSVEAVKQVALADRLLLTKTDIAAPDTLAPLRRRLTALNPGAAVIVAENGVVAADALFGAALFDPARKSVDVQRWLNEAAYAPEQHDHAAHGHHHADGIVSFCLSYDAPLDWDAVSQWLWLVRRDIGEQLLRVKGVLNLRGESAPVAIHGVHHVFHPPVALAAWPDADRRSRLVFITRGISRAQVEESFARHLLTPA